MVGRSPVVTWSSSPPQVELLVASEADMASAANEISAFMAAHGLGHTGGGVQAEGKVDAFLRRCRPEHYAALVKCGVVKTKAQ